MRKFFFGALALGLSANTALAEDKLALIIANGTYTTAQAVEAAATDAAQVAEALESVGFTVTMALDTRLEDMKAAVANFSTALGEAAPDSTAVFYYTGHGLQAFETNYLLPTDAAIVDPADLDFSAVEVDTVLTQMMSGNASTSILVLDCCETTPFPGIRAEGEIGLAPMEAAPGSYLVFSASPGEVLPGGPGSAGFATALAQTVGTPGLTIDEVVTQTGVLIADSSGGSQSLWSSSGLNAPVVLVAQPPGGASEEEIAEWDLVRESGDPISIILFLETYPEGGFADAAKRLLGDLVGIPMDPDFLAATDPDAPAEPAESAAEEVPVAAVDTPSAAEELTAAETEPVAETAAVEETAPAEPAPTEVAAEEEAPEPAVEEVAEATPPQPTVEEATEAVEADQAPESEATEEIAEVVEAPASDATTEDIAETAEVPSGPAVEEVATAIEAPEPEVQEQPEAVAETAEPVEEEATEAATVAAAEPVEETVESAVEEPATGDATEVAQAEESEPEAPAGEVAEADAAPVEETAAEEVATEVEDSAPAEVEQSAEETVEVAAVAEPDADEARQVRGVSVAEEVPSEADLIARAEASRSAEDYAAYLAAYPNGIYAELFEVELALLREEEGFVEPSVAETPVEVAAAPQIDDALAAATTPEGVFFDTPLTVAAPEIVGKSIADLIKGTPLFPPVEGLPQSYWQDKTCSNCHKWTQTDLCEQANFYTTAIGADSVTKQHPYGGTFKENLRLWAEAGCP